MIRPNTSQLVNAKILHKKLRPLACLLLICSLSFAKSCKPKPVKARFSKLEKLPKSLRECSGMVRLDSEHLVFINDSGNSAHLWVYKIGVGILQKLEHPNLNNEDWEDLAITRKAGGIQLFIADIGNNDNDRTDLLIYEVALTQNQKNKKTPYAIKDVKEHPLRYSDQKKFSDKSDIYLDAEALVVREDSFYIFTRNRSKPFNGKTRMYTLPLDSQTHVAKFVSEIEICNDSKDCKVTGASINNSGDSIALLTYDKVFVLEVKSHGLDSFKTHRIDLEHSSQKESISFTEKGDLLIADERRKKEGGNLYLLDL